MMNKITIPTLLAYLLCFFTTNMNAQDGYTYTLVDNGSFSYTIAAVPNASTSNFATSVQSYGFSIILPDGITANITSSLGSGAGATFFDGTAIGQPTIDGYLITETLGSPIALPAPSAGVNSPMVTIQLVGAPTTGIIFIFPNDAGIAPLQSFMSADMIDDGMALFPAVVDNVGTGLSGTTSYDFSTLSVAEDELIGLTVFPNPANAIVHIQSANESLENIEIFNTNGQLVLSQKDNLETINTSSLQSGIYFIKIHTEDTSKTIKLIKK